MNEPPPPLKSMKPDLVVSDMLELLLFKCLQKSPENRFQTVADLKSALQTAFPEPKKPERDVSSRMQRTIAKPPPPPKMVESKSGKTSKRSHIKGIIVLLIVMIICMVGIFFAVKSRTPAVAPNTVPPAAAPKPKPAK